MFVHDGRIRFLTMFASYSKVLVNSSSRKIPKTHSSTYMMRILSKLFMRFTPVGLVTRRIDTTC